MSNGLGQFRNAFFEEAAELVDRMEATLLGLDLQAVEAEDLHTLFRAAHSIKGNAATFGFPGIAAFTHQVESALEPVRRGDAALTTEWVECLLRTVDLLRTQLDHAAQGTVADPELLASQAKLVASLLNLAGAGAAVIPPAPAAAPATDHTGYLIRFAAPLEAFRRGINLERTFRDLERLGPCRFRLDDGRLPPIQDLEPEDCFLAWEIRLESRASMEEVEEVFEFVAEGDNLVIRPTREYPESAPLGEMLLAEGSASPEAVAAALALQRPLGALLVDMGAIRPEELDKVLERQKQKRSSAETGTLRVATGKIDSLVNLVGELVITQAMLVQSSQSLLSGAPEEERFTAAMVQLDRQTRELQDRVMGIRMVPVEAVFSRFPRMVRELGNQIGKEVELILEGQATELDKTFIEKLVDPLTHLVRNAVDHGLETPDERRAAAKPGKGRILLKASSRGGQIHIEVTDDGRGLDRERILRKAVQRGLAPSGTHLTDEAVFDLIFEPGFSTVETVTDLSGRGVGMDVVRQNTRALGGRIEVESRPGQGCTFRLVLPLTLAILDGLTIQVADEIYVIPLTSVLESFQPRPGAIQTVQGDCEVINVRGEFIPVLRLHRFLGLPGAGEPALLVLVESEGRCAALAVDDLVGQQQVVIKSLETHFRRVDGISGATILGDGRVALILDVPGLLKAQEAQGSAP